MSNKFFNKEKYERSRDELQGWQDGAGKYVLAGLALLIVVFCIISAVSG